MKSVLIINCFKALKFSFFLVALCQLTPSIIWHSILLLASFSYNKRHRRHLLYHLLERDFDSYFLLFLIRCTSTLCNDKKTRKNSYLSFFLDMATSYFLPWYPESYAVFFFISKFWFFHFFLKLRLFKFSYVFCNAY